MTDWAIALHEYFGDEALSQLDDSLCSDMTSYATISATWKNLLPLPSEQVLTDSYETYLGLHAILVLPKTYLYSRQENTSCLRVPMQATLRVKV